MNRITIAAVALCMALASVASAQYGSGDQNSMTITSGPWILRRSTGDKMTDQLTFIMDRTLNAPEKATLKEMFWDMPGDTSYYVRKAIVNAIDNNPKNSSSMSFLEDNGMTDGDVYQALLNGVSWSQRGVLYDLPSTATTSQMMAIRKLVKCGGWAYAQWQSSGMNT